MDSRLIATEEPRAIHAAAISQLFYDHVRRVQAYVRHHHPGEDVDDIVSETFLVACRKSAEIEVGKEAAWLIGVARLTVQNSRRSARRRERFVEALVAARPRVSTELSDDGLIEDLEPLQAAFSTLRESDQEILLLAAWEGVSGSELAGILGIPNGRAADRLHRARKRLRAAMPIAAEEDPA